MVVRPTIWTFCSVIFFERGFERDPAILEYIKLMQDDDSKDKQPCREGPIRPSPAFCLLHGSMG
jgi:hypothetical protein